MKREIVACGWLFLLIAISFPFETESMELELFGASLIIWRLLLPWKDQLIMIRFRDEKAWKKGLFQQMAEYCGFAALFMTLSKLWSSFLSQSRLAYVLTFARLSAVLFFAETCMVAWAWNIVFAVVLLAAYIMFTNLVPCLAAMILCMLVASLCSWKKIRMNAEGYEE